MDVKELISRHSPFIKKNWLPLSLGILGMIFFAYGLIGLFSSGKSASNDIVFESNLDKNPAEGKNILVDIEGAVVKPGVYKLPLESRIQDGLVAAGGLSAQADREFISKNFNLATKLSDGTKIYVPSIGEAVNGASLPNPSLENAAAGSVRNETSLMININTSSQSDLESLPGIGSVTAQKIISGRPYNSVDNLLEKKIVGAKVFDKIKDKITVY